MSAQDILAAIKSRDWHAANQAFSQTMQQKLADRLAVERKQTFKEARLTEAFDQATVQRVFDENHDILETELLCNVESLTVNESGQVISYIAKD